MIPKKGKSIPTGVLEPVSVCNSACSFYRLPDTFPQTQLPKTIIVMILSAASDRNPNSNQLKKRKRTLFALKTEESRGSPCFRYGLIQAEIKWFLWDRALSLDFSVLLPWCSVHAQAPCAHKLSATVPVPFYANRKRKYASLITTKAWELNTLSCGGWDLCQVTMRKPITLFRRLESADR